LSNAIELRQLIMVVIETLPGTAETRGALELPRRDVFIWTCVIIFLNQIFGIAKETTPASFAEMFTDFAAIGVFQLMAWYAIFRLLFLSEAASAAHSRDILVAAALCLLIFLPSSHMIWAAALGVGVFGLFVNKGDPKLLSAGIILVALSVQQCWGRIFFRIFEIPLLRAETAVVGTIMQIARAGTQWQDNVIIGPGGFGIVMYDWCSSFHNLSLAMLCWLTVTNLRNQSWQPRDFIVGCVVGATMILSNIARLCLMSWNIDLYEYWHAGAGEQIFDAGASAMVLLISLIGSRALRR
jgi:hypothetical protein